MRIGITGHRPETSGPLLKGYSFDFFASLLRRQVQSILSILSKDEPSSVLITGGARGFDLVRAESALELGWEVELRLPFPVETHTAKWQKEDPLQWDLRLDWVVKHPRTVKIPPVTQSYNPRAYLLRDQAIVDACDVMLSFWNGQGKGGTYLTTRMALKSGKPVWNLNPLTGQLEHVVKVQRGEQ